MVRYIENMQQFEEVVELSKTKLVVIDFTASWCGPCRFIAPEFEKLAEENPDVEFVKVDVDEANDVSDANGVRAMPTFHFLKGGQKVAELMGANLDKLTALVAQHKCDLEQELRNEAPTSN